MSHILLTLVPVFGIIILGGIAERKHILPPTSAKCFGQFVYYFALPSVLFSLMVQVRPEQFSWQAALAFLMGMMLTLWLVTLLLRLMKYSLAESSMAGLAASFPNGAFMGIPIIFLLFPNNTDAGLAVGLAVIMPTIPLIYTELVLTFHDKKQTSSASTIKNVFVTFMHNPNILVVIVGFILGLSGVALPSVVMEGVKMIGSTAAPCALFCMGMSFAAQLSTYSTRKQEHIHTLSPKRKIMGQGIVLFAKLVFSPALVYILCVLLGLEGTMLATMTIVAGMPSAVAVHILADRYEIFAENCVFIVILGTFFSAFTLPMLMSLLIV